MTKLKTSEEIEIMAEGGKILKSVMDKIIDEAEEGISLKDLDKLAESLIRKAGARPAFLNYRPDGATNPYKASICASLNDVVVHGFPDHRKLKNGDLLKLDFGVLFKGYNTDAALTVPVGKISEIGYKLIKATEEALLAAIKRCLPGNTLGDIGYEIEKKAIKSGFKVVKDLVGHGIGRDLHEEPVIYNYGAKKKGLKLITGMVLAIEPMLSAGSDKVIQKPDESWATSDGSLSCHFEHTVAITEKGPRVLTV